MKPREYFPLGTAHGEAFCNRKTEREWLINNIQAYKHSLLIAPRRFGKSSLAEESMEASNLPTEVLNFNICTDEQDIELLIRQGVSQLVGKALGPVEKILNSIKNYVTHLTPKISIGPEYAHFELATNKQSSPASNVEEALILIEKLLAEKKRSAVMLFDEFQVVGVIAKGSGVEAAIRNAAQNMKHLSIIFSGSNRSLLQSMFEDEARPLYKLCRKLYLKKIDASHYRSHINRAAKLTWRKNLEETVFQRIIELSEKHPYYVNYLCDVVWTECKALPKTEDVEAAWQLVIEEEKSDAQAEIGNLSMGQKKVLKYIANFSGKNLLSAEVGKMTGMALSSIAGAITGLLEKDIIEKQEDCHAIINPVIKNLLITFPVY